jgi:hypothetical protein
MQHARRTKSEIDLCGGFNNACAAGGDDHIAFADFRSLHDRRRAFGGTGRILRIKDHTRDDCHKHNRTGDEINFVPEKFHDERSLRFEMGVMIKFPRKE